MKLTVFDKAVDYGSPDRPLEVTITCETDLSPADLMTLAELGKRGDPEAAARVRRETAWYVTYHKAADPTTLVLSDTQNAVKRPKGMTAANRKLNRLKVPAFKRNDPAYRGTYLENLQRFLGVARSYETLTLEERERVDLGIAYVTEFQANVTCDLMAAEQVRFHTMAKS